MIITKEVEMRWEYRNKQWYIDKGYKFTKWKDSFTVDISDLPKGSRVDIEYQCSCCGNAIKTQYANYNLYTDHLCRNCAAKVKSSAKLRQPFKPVVALFELKGYTLISTEEEFKNAHSKLRYICPEHGTQSISYSKLRYGRGCPRCGGKSASLKQRDSWESIRRLFLDNNTILLSTEDDYVNSKSKLRYLCDIHGEQEISIDKFKQGHRCELCSIELRSRSGHHNWQGGITELTRYLRAHLKPWIQRQLQRTKHACEITGAKSSGDLNVHHMTSFATIRDLTLEQLGLPVYATIGEYGDDLQLLTDTFLENNEAMANPIVMLESVHQEFHSFCGGNSEDTTMEQLQQFKESLKARMASLAYPA